MLRMLDDVSVLDAGHVLAGPFCSYQLAMLGARVTRVENPRGNDFARRHGGPDALRAGSADNGAVREPAARCGCGGTPARQPRIQRRACATGTRIRSWWPS